VSKRTAILAPRAEAAGETSMTCPITLAPAGILDPLASGTSCMMRALNTWPDLVLVDFKEELSLTGRMVPLGRVVCANTAIANSTRLANSMRFIWMMPSALSCLDAALAARGFQPASTIYKVLAHTGRPPLYFPARGITIATGGLTP
jgi:hypothetical protein